MILADVMDDVARRLSVIEGLRAYEWPPDKVDPPAAVVSYPESMPVHGTYQRGGARMTLPVVIVVGRYDARSTRDLLSAYVDSEGPQSVTRVLESRDFAAYTAFDSLQASEFEFDVVTIAGVDHMAAMLDLDIIGSG